jgi:hypothetical protein
MKKFNSIVIATICMFGFQNSQAQLCTGNKGPNLLGAKGTFSAPFITVNTSAASCLSDGSNTYNPNGNIGNALAGCTAAIGDIIPCSDYGYTAASNGMQPEFTYSIMKVMGDENGSNCIHSPIWQAKDHTGDGGYFMAVNGAPNQGYSPLFYQIKTIPVCIGTTYEFSAWVINMMPPGGDASAAPNISFVVNGNVIGTSGPIPYDRQWHQVGGQFTPTISDVADPAHPTVDLQVINATQVAGGNDLGLDDISFRVCQSRIVVDGPAIVTEGASTVVHYTVSDPIDQNTWWKIQMSSDGGSTFGDITTGDVGTFGPDHTYTVDYPIFGGIAALPQWNGFQFRILVSTSKIGLDNPDCIYVNEYRIIVASGGPLPVKLASFSGTYSDGVSTLNWQTSQELNNDRFELFRSYNGNDFELAASVAGAGNSYTPKSYSYQDRIGAAQGNYVFYKLKQIDKDGKFTFSNVIRLSLSNTASSFQVFPNPVVNNFTASFSAPKTGTATLLIRNTSGQTVYRKTVDVIKGNNSVQVNTPQLNTGMYYINVVNDEINYNAKIQKL